MHQMIGIYEQGDGKGIGYGLNDFLQRFDEICASHLKEGRAKEFAFIFYDFLDKDFREVLFNQAVFTKLDRLSGEDLSIFFLHANRHRSAQAFNSEFLGRLDLSGKVTLPCVVFFKYEGGEKNVGSVEVLTTTDQIHALDELKTVITNHLAGKDQDTVYWKFTKKVAKVVGIEAIKEGLKAVLF